MTKLEIYKGQQMPSLSLESKNKEENEGSLSVRLSIRRIVELSTSGIFHKPINQRDMTKSEVMTNAKLYFGNLLFRLKYNKKGSFDIEEIPELTKAEVASLGDLTFTVKRVDEKQIIDYQDGQHRIHYLQAIINNEVPLQPNLKFVNKGVNPLVQSIFMQAAQYGLDTSKGIYFCMLPDDIQESILNMQLTASFFNICNEDDRRTLYDLQNTCVSMSPENRQKNIYAGTPIYEELQRLSAAFNTQTKNKYHSSSCKEGSTYMYGDYPEYLAKRHRDLLNQLLNGEEKGKGNNVSASNFVPLMYRCILASENSTKYFLENQKAWKYKDSKTLANEFLREHSNLTTKEAQALIKKTCQYMYLAASMLNDTKSANSIFAGRLALLPASIYAYRILVEKKDKVAKSIVFSKFKEPSVRLSLLKLCSEKSTIVSSTYFNPEYTYATFTDVLLQASKVIKETFDK